MSQFKPTARSQHSSSKASLYREKVTQLRELFPDLSVDELEILLAEVSGDVQLAAARIADGALQPWGEVSRKKDKKPPVTHVPKPSAQSRSDSRGTRGGRGGRSGARGRGGYSKPTNGHIPLEESTSTLSTWAALSNGSPGDGKTSGVESFSKTSNEHEPSDSISPSTSARTDLSSQRETISGVASSWGNTLEGVNGSSAQTLHPPTNRPPSKTPATSKLSWAQIARPQEKITHPVAQSNPIAIPVVRQQSENETDVESITREEPTTVEGPPWDDSRQLPNTDAWPPTAVTAEAIEVEAQPVVSPIPPSKALEPVPESTGDIKSDPASTSPLLVASVLASSSPNPIVTSSPKLISRPAVSSHRSGARHKVTDQPVTLPLSFGAGVEKVGMQFGSLSIGDDSTAETPQHEAEGTLPEPTPAAQSKIEVAVPHPPPATAPATSTSLTSMFQQSQQAPSNMQTSISHHTLPTSISQPISSNQTNIHTTSSPLHNFPQQTSAHQQQPTSNHNIHQSQVQTSHLQHQSHLPQQLQPVHSINQHGLLGHLDQGQPTQTQQSLQAPAHSTYLRGSDVSSTTPFFHASTPPVVQSQDGSYGSFSTQGQQQQAPQSSGFGNNDYAFYESYSAQQNFISRNHLGHDEVKAIPGAQQNSASPLPTSATQGPQSHSAQASTQQQPGQGPQQTYPPPVPYYFPHAYPQNQFYGSPYSSGYVPQPFVKYPAIFQAGPPGPGTAGNPTAKQPGNVGVQPQTPYNGSLYQQAGYDDYQSHQQHSQHQQPQHTHSLGLTQSMSEYSKLYGAGQGSMQGFMGLGGQSSSGSAGPTSNGAPRGSPEASYKPYGKGMDVTRNVQGQQGPGQVPTQSQGQGANSGNAGQNFYGGNRFGTGVGTSSSGGQQGGQPHLGYPQGVNESNFYGYQPRQQQGYWQ